MILARDGHLFGLVPRRQSGPQPLLRDGQLTLQAETQWLLRGPEEPLDTIRLALGIVAERLGPELVLIEFGTAVGLVDVPILGWIKLESGKWSEQHFEEMLRDLMRVASALPFAAGTASALPFDRSVVARHDVLYHAFVYLRHALSSHAAYEEQLLPPLRMVLREPHRRLERMRRDVPVDLARRVDAASLVKIASGSGRPMPLQPADAARIPLVRVLRGHVPAQVEEGQVRSTFDTPENRFVKAFVGQALGVVDAIRGLAELWSGTPSFGRRLLADCDAMDRALAPIVRDPFWGGVGPMVHLPVASTVLQRRRGYRELFGHFSRLRLAARVPLDAEQTRRLLDTKDIAELYELWVYFAVVREVEGILGRPVRAGQPRVGEFSVAVERSFAVTWGDGTTVSYNLSFSRSQATARRSFSVPLRPDVSLDVPSGPNAGLHLFDAKFKLDRLDAVLSAAEDVADAAEERRGSFKRGDLYKMHTYRDAIPRARSVWILYPGSEFQFFPSEGAIARSGDDLPTMLDGVGGIPLRPDDDRLDELRAVLLGLLGSTS